MLWEYRRVRADQEWPTAAVLVQRSTFRGAFLLLSVDFDIG